MRAGWRLRAGGLLALGGFLALAGCAQQEDAFAPACPQPSMPRDFNDVHQYRGEGRDVTDLMLNGRITGIQGACRRDGANTVTADVSVAIELARGPALKGRTAEVAYFVAVSEGDAILDKQVFRVQAEFAANSDRVRFSGEEVELRLPVTGRKSAAAYRISVGFELTPQELEINRRRERR